MTGDEPLASQVGDLTDDGGGLVDVDVVDDDPGAFCRAREGEGPAESTAGSGDHDRRPAQP